MEAALPWFSRLAPGSGMVLLILVSIFLISTDSWACVQRNRQTDIYNLDLPNLNSIKLYEVVVEQEILIMHIC